MGHPPRAGWYHTHAGYDPGVNIPNNVPGSSSYNWHNDGNEIFSPDDMNISDLINGPGVLGTPRGTTEVYVPVPGNPRGGSVHVMSGRQCVCGSN